MDPRTTLILIATPEPSRWEDQEKSTNDVKVLTEEFRQRLYAPAAAGVRAGSEVSSLPGDGTTR
jgi:hypothetical protein